MTDDNKRQTNFITEIIDGDLKSGKHRQVVTRFPPEPNGYLHIGHAKSISLNFGLAQQYGGKCHLRFDDTNPTKEDTEFVDSIQDDIRWLGFDWGANLFFASDYFDQLYAHALHLITLGLAYVDSQSREQIRESRGTLTRRGTDSPYRGRSVEENLDLFRRMKEGQFEEGAHVLRAKIDMSSPNIVMRDPIIYRILYAHHHRTGDKWCIYPMYDFTHCLSDSIEGITHSVCTLEFEINRPLYDWVLDHTPVSCHPQQIEFSRMNLNYTVMSKRKLLQLVTEKHVAGWDDPRMPTLAGLRRRGCTPEAIRALCEMVGTNKVKSIVDMEKFDFCLRDDLNHRAPRIMCVKQPLKLVITDYPADRTEWLEAPRFPADVGKPGTRQVPFTRELFIERDDFLADPPKNWHRLAPGQEVRLRYGYVVRCTDVETDAAGEVLELHCTHDAATLGRAPEGRKVRGAIHWVSASHARGCEIREYDRLFSAENPDAGPEHFLAYMNPDSLRVVTGALIEPSVAEDAPDTHYQFEREGYYWQDPVDSTPARLVFNRVIALRDSWSKQQAEAAQPDRPLKGSLPELTAQSPAVPTQAQAKVRPDRSPALQARMRHYIEAVFLSEDDADLLTRDPALADFFDAAIAAHSNAQATANWIINALLPELRERALAELPFSPQRLAQLIQLVDTETISARIAKQVFGEMLESGADPETIVDAHGWRQLADHGALESMVAGVVAANPAKVAEYRGGKTGLLGFFVGQVMRESQGKADPRAINALLRRALDGAE